MGRIPSAETRRRIVDAALDCFTLEGIRATSADDVIDRAGVAKMTLYNYFPTKEKLAAAFVREKSDRWIAWLTSRVSKPGLTKKGRVLALFDALDEWFRSDDYNGCPFHRSAAEFPNPANPIHKEVAHNKEQFYALMRRRLADAKVKHPSKVARQFLILAAGAETMNNIDEQIKYVAFARDAAAKLLR
jgi:AcrR family transcriptional regulator